ncbi:hypothetical protein BHE90_013260 [Fusarium euwallaceae]|uniref:Uncharacterized protein n=3 Tax=Fusarium solani species complex TaxID=232080 RepID=A0A3M2RTN8_9HYPO|nr:hypothetical protein CDV36_011697 [Fusarium kuroshium]RSL41238.1 hypothetical protein CEP53_012871 [Fusarium sp. AF-6]RSM02681.1 hypothetical protein CEP52_007780 [Fusarium oligoseptatum]RTE72328.1 hypothetical protein BHE90_013260 [Fusarium euwallaceae]
MSNHSYNSWLKTKKKPELAQLAQQFGLQDVAGSKKDDLGIALDTYLSENSSRYLADPELAGYFNSRSKALGSPVKREVIRDEVEKPLKVSRRRTTTKLSEEITPESDDGSPQASSPQAASPQAVSTALIETPGRALSQVAARIPLPATPADVALAVDRSTSAVRQRVSSMYEESGITEVSHATRDTLSTVTSVLFCVAAWELWNVRREVLSNIYAFTIPAIQFLGTSDYPVYVPDMFLLLSSSFWSPTLTWIFTSVAVPSFMGYFFNLSATSTPPTRGRLRSNNAEYVVDPLTFSIVKALISFVVYGQGVNFGGLLNDMSIVRLNNAIYGGYKGILTGTAITGLMSIYDAVLRK